MTKDYAALREYAIAAFPPYIGWKVEQIPTDGKDPDGWKRWAAHFRLTLTNGRTSETFDYWMGVGHWKWKSESWTGVPEAARMANGKICSPADCLQSKLLCFEDKPSIVRRCRCDAPHPVDILNSLLLDALATEQTFEDWCSDFGYDTDSRKAEQTYRECDENGKRLYRILGRDLCDTIRSRIDEHGGL